VSSGPLAPEPRRDFGPDDAIRQLAARAAEEGPPLLVRADPDSKPAFGLLASAGPRTSGRSAAYAFVVEAVREGYLCHYEAPRVLEKPDPDLALLAGDLFYAIGIRALAELDDEQSVGLLSDLIVAAAELRSDGRREAAEIFWVARVSALACGSDLKHERLSAALVRGEEGSTQALEDWTDSLAEACGIGRQIDEVRHLIHFASNP
jgi:hypothetical protein